MNEKGPEKKKSKKTLVIGGTIASVLASAGLGFLHREKPVREDTVKQPVIEKKEPVITWSPSPVETPTVEYAVKQEYLKPRQGDKILIENANFSIFPEKLNFKLDRTTMIVSRTWQTAAIYNQDGTLMRINGKKGFLVSTGLDDFPTRLGLYDIQTKMSAIHRSREYGRNGRLAPGQEGGLMPYAMHLGEMSLVNGELKSNRHTGVALHAKAFVRPEYTTKGTTHACIGLEIGFSKFLNGRVDNDKRGIEKPENDQTGLLKIGDNVIVVEDQLLTEARDIRDYVPMQRREISQQKPLK